MNGRFVVPAMLLAAMVFACPGRAGEAETVFRIESRWVRGEALCARDGGVGYGRESGTAGQWTLHEVDGYYRIRNVDTGTWLALHDTEGPALVFRDANETDALARWEIGSAADSYWSIRSAHSGRYITIERERNAVECGGRERPFAKNIWAGQWRLVHVAGPKPGPIFQRGQVRVMEPAYGSTIDGTTTVRIRAPGLRRIVARCWQAGEGFGSDSIVAEVELDERGEGAFVFPAERYPHGPVMVRIAGTDGVRSDNCYLQLYNAAGVRWNTGMPDQPPPPAEGMKLVFADDFKGPLSISRTGKDATYCSHKPGGGDFSGFAFGDHESGASPFSQVDTYLRIRADASRRTTGLISSLRMDGTGITAQTPCYFECRLTAQSAPGTWPAFWLMTRGVYKGLREPADELDTLEAYGGEGPGNPNQTGYWVTSHYWNQGAEGKAQPRVNKQIPMTRIGGGASWFTTFHIYGTLITETDTIYYLDNIEVARHPTGRLSKTEPLFFFINFAIGGTSGWPIDLSRYDGVADMYVDYVRVYQK